MKQNNTSFIVLWAELGQRRVRQPVRWGVSVARGSWGAKEGESDTVRTATSVIKNFFKN